MAGEINVDAMLRRITARQFRNWEIFNELEPFGDIRSDYRSAQITQMVYNMNVGLKDRKPLKDFVLVFEEKEEKKPQTFEDQIAIAKLWVAAVNSGSLEMDS